MDIIDLWWNASQQVAIDELRAGLSTAQVSSRTTVARQAELLRLMQEENDDLRLRLGVLIRLLVKQGAISAEEYAAAVSEAKESVARTARAQAIKKRAASLRPTPGSPKSE